MTESAKAVWFDGPSTSKEKVPCYFILFKAVTLTLLRITKIPIAFEFAKGF